VRSLSVRIGAAGALIDVEVGVVGARRAALLKAGLPVPPVQRVSLLIDTGASSTVIDEGVMRSMGLNPTGATRFHSSSGAGVAHPGNLYDMALVLGGVGTVNALRFDALPVLGTAFINHGFDGLLGRSVLNRLKMAWNGPAGELVIEYT
jgi:predicted aspartyl protease